MLPDQMENGSDGRLAAHRLSQPTHDDVVRIRASSLASTRPESCQIYSRGPQIYPPCTETGAMLYPALSCCLRHLATVQNAKAVFPGLSYSIDPQPSAEPIMQLSCDFIPASFLNRPRTIALTARPMCSSRAMEIPPTHRNVSSPPPSHQRR